jgi:hypothetical protein
MVGHTVTTTRHWIVENAVHEEFITAARDSLPTPESVLWEGNDTKPRPEGRRVRLRPWLPYAKLPEVCWNVLDQAIAIAVETTGIPMIDLRYGGAFQMLEGDVSDLHIDRNLGCRTHTFQLYLTETVGGALSFDDEIFISPKPGKLVIWEMSDSSWHGVTEVHGGRRLSLGANLRVHTHPEIRGAFYADQKLNP